jgi:transposase
MASLFVYVGLDYHEDSVRVCVMDKHGEVLLNRDLPNDVESVRDGVRRCGLPQAVAIEACGGAAEFADQLQQQTRWRIRLAHPGYVKRLKQGPDKSDHGDAWLLADLVRIGYLPEVWRADQVTRQLRHLVHYRQGLVADRKRIKLRIRALLREERVPCHWARAWTKAWFGWLSQATLREHSRWIMDQELRRLERLNQEIRDVEERLAQATADDELTQRLLAQAGIGPITAATLRAEVGRFDRFGNGKQLARFCGVTPCNASSGRREADAGLVKAGSPALRAVIIQAAQRLPRQEPRWRALKERLRRTKPANVATAAVANRWLRWLHHQMLPAQQLAIA